MTGVKPPCDRETGSPTLDHFQLVNVVVPVWVPDRAGMFKFRSPQRNVGKVAVSPDNIRLRRTKASHWYDLATFYLNEY